MYVETLTVQPQWRTAGKAGPGQEYFCWHLNVKVFDEILLEYLQKLC